MKKPSLEKTVVVTGAGRGIGRAVASRFVRAGCRVLACSRSGDELQSAVDKIRSETGLKGAIEAVAADQSRPEDAVLLAERISAWGTGLDILVNNASILGPMTSIAEFPLEGWNAVLAINLTGPFLVTRALLPLMNHGGLIVNITSSVGRAGRARWGAYAVSKFGLEGLTQILADEVSDRGITVVSLNPGGTRTRMRSSAYPNEDPRRLRDPAEAADVLIQLADGSALFPSGAMLDIERGRPVVYRPAGPRVAPSRRGAMKRSKR